MEKVIKLFMQIIKAEVTGESLREDVIADMTPEMMERLYRISNKHDMAHIIAAFLQKQNMLGEDAISKKYSQALYMAVLRYENIRYELERISELFNSEQIAFMPLKGSVIRRFYVEPWLRTSCDIDILIRFEDLDRACELLSTRFDYRKDHCSAKDVSLFSPSGVHLELHFKMQKKMDTLGDLLSKVWTYAHPIEEESCQYEMTAEFFLFYIFAHMYRHFSTGGCGMRTFVDIWLLTTHLKYDEVVLQKLCEDGEIWQFVQVARRLIEVWFEGKPYDELSRRMESYVVVGGTYGTSETSMTVKKTETPGRVKYLLKRIFMGYKSLCTLYPRLEQMPILYPYYTIVRWCTVLNADVFNRVTKEAKLNGDIQKEKVDELRDLFNELGLK